MKPRIRFYGNHHRGTSMLVRLFNSMPEDLDDIEHLPSDSAALCRIVRAITDTNNIFHNLELEPLHYWNPPGWPRYQLFGDELITKDPSPANARGRFVHLSSVLRSSAAFVACEVNPKGRQVMRHIHRNECPAKCERGWLRNVQSLLPYMRGSGYEVPHLGAFKPLCPVCFSLRLVIEQIEMRLELEGNVEPDWPEFSDRFCDWQDSVAVYNEELMRIECLCIMCAMPSSRGPAPLNHEDAVAISEGLRMDALIPDVQDDPVDEDTLADLPRLAYEESASNETQCPICLTDFSADCAVLCLPCDHLICADGCIEWLRHRNSCPLCRKRVESTAQWPSDDDNDELVQNLSNLSLVRF